MSAQLAPGVINSLSYRLELAPIRGIKGKDSISFTQPDPLEDNGLRIIKPWCGH